MRPKILGLLSLGLMTYVGSAPVNAVDIPLYVFKTVDTSFTREWVWSIDKTSLTELLTLGIGESESVHYTVNVTKDSYLDSNFQISGGVQITNEGEEALTIFGVTDNLSDGTPVSLDCGGVDFTDGFVLEVGASINCTYSQELSDGESLQNTVSVDLGDVGSFESDPVSVQFDEFESDVTQLFFSVDVYDDKAGFLGLLSESSTFDYDLDCGPFAAIGQYWCTNEARIWFRGEDTDWSSTANVFVTVIAQSVPEPGSLALLGLGLLGLGLSRRKAA